MRRKGLREMGYKCPICYSEVGFSIDITTTINVNSEGGLRNIPQLLEEIDGNSPITCQACNHHGLVHEFED